MIGIFENNSIKSLYYFVGSTVAIILGFLQIYAYTQDRIKIEIDLIVTSFVTYPPSQVEDGSIEERGYTKIIIDADIKNKGRQPVTISMIELKGSNDKYSFGLFNGNNAYRFGFHRPSFDPIRLDSNDRQLINIFNTELPYIKNLKSVEWTILFYTCNKIIKKEIEQHL